MLIKNVIRLSKKLGFNVIYYGCVVCTITLISQNHIAADKNTSSLPVPAWMASDKVIMSEVTKLKDLAAIEGISFGTVFNNQPRIIFATGLTNSKSQQVVKPDTIFQAASLSKPVLAYIVLKMVQRGEITLDQPLFEILENPRIADGKWAKLITPRLVLSHQTGLPNWGGDKLTFNFEPGTAFNYSGEGYVYLQRVLEKINGLSYQALVTREVFKPLGMVDSYFTWDESQTLKLAYGHNRAGQPSELRVPEANAAASLHTTPGDFIKFIMAWFDDKNITQSSRDMAFSSIVDTTSYKKDLTEISWGLGWGIYTKDKTKIAWHWGDNGIYRSFVALDPNAKNAFVYFTNSENGLAIAKQMTELFYPGNPAINDWLGYGQADTEVWQTEHMGYVYEAQGEYAKAIEQFETVLQTFPDSGRIKGKINWIKPYIENKGQTINLTPAYLKKISGMYDDRKLFVENGQLKYQRGDRVIHSLTPMNNQLFKVGELASFRLEVLFDANENPIKLVGHYEGGHQDESARTK